MSGFRDSVAEDGKRVFLNLEEFAEFRTIIYDGTVFDGPEHRGIPVVLSGLREQERRQLVSDHTQGLYLVTAVLHCAREDLGGVQPEKGQRIRIGEGTETPEYFREFYVAASVCEFGILRVELEAVGE